jgi:hypothetical protein
MSFTFRMPAPEGSRFMPGAFVSQVGNSVPLRFESELGTALMSGVIVSIEVASDGLSAEITVEPDGDPIALDGDCRRCGRPRSEHTGDECPPPLWPRGSK